MVNEKDLKPITGLKKEYDFPKTYEQFILEQKQEQSKVIDESYRMEFEACNNVNVPKSYGPSPEQHYSDSSGNYVKVTVEVNERAERARKAEAWKDGYLEGVCFMYDLGDGLDPNRYGKFWVAHEYASNIGYASEVNEGRSAGRIYGRKYVEASHRMGSDYPVEPKNPYKD